MTGDLTDLNMGKLDPQFINENEIMYKYKSNKFEKQNPQTSMSFKSKTDLSLFMND